MTTNGSPLYHRVSLDQAYLAGKMLDRYAEVHRKTWEKCSPRRRERIREEFMAAILSLQESLATGSPAFLIEYACHEQSRFMSRHFPGGFVVSYLEILKEVAAHELTPDYRKTAGAYIRKAISVLKTAPPETGSCDATRPVLSSEAQSFLDAILVADRLRAEAIINKLLSSGNPAQNIYTQIFQPVLIETGRLWQQNEASIDQEHYITCSIREIMIRIHNEMITRGTTKKKGKTVVTACAGEELHEIGIRMVADFFAFNGWNVYFIGANTPVKCIIAAAKKQKADVVALSITMPSRLPDLEYLIRSLRADPETRPVKIIVGGYPFSVMPDLWKQVGADAGAASAEEAVAAADRLTADKSGGN